MIKVVIADDEMKVRILLSKLVDWEGLGFSIVGEACNGIEALQLIADASPDLLITDIRMPGCDGIELIRQAREIAPSMRIIIVSGYRQFEYAKSAIRYGVEDYLLKPIKEQELTAILKDISEKLNATQVSDPEEHREMNKALSRQLFMEKLCEAAETGAAVPSYALINEKYGLHFGEGDYETVLFQPFLPNNDKNLSAYEIMLKRSSEIVRGQLENHVAEYAVSIAGGGVAAVIYSLDTDAIGFQRLLTGICKKIENQRDLFWNMDVVVHTAHTVHDTTELPGAIGELCWLSKQQILLDKKVSMTYRDIPAGTELGKVFRLTPREKKQFYSAGEYVSFSQLEEQTAALRERFRDENATGCCIHDCFLEACRSCLDALSGREGASTEETTQQLEKGYGMCASVDELFTYAGNLLKAHFDAVSGAQAEKELKPILEAKQYIKQHYSEALRLEDVSSVVGFNATYFSTVFKKETGLTFLDYLTQVRIEEAKRILCDGSIGITEVAEMVGYRDIKYFSKLFKKSTGLNPSEYKRLYQ